MVPIPIQFFHTVWQVFTEYYGTFPVLSRKSLPDYHMNGSHIIMVISNRDLSCDNLLIDSRQKILKPCSIIINFKCPILKVIF
jgi:hypothetical protein